MSQQPHQPVAASAGAIFLSYARQDTRAAQCIRDSLSAEGIETWLDQSDLRGGDAWDQKIRRQISDCALFMPLISSHTQQRLEGYFRLEWRLAVTRSQLMADERPFLVPVVLDDTLEKDAIVPDLFKTVQWTRLPAGATGPVFIDHVRRLLSSGPSATKTAMQVQRSAAATAVPGNWRAIRADGWRWAALLVFLAAVALLAVAYVGSEKISSLREGKRSTPISDAASKASPPNTPTSPFSPPAHSIAVLPFVNLSGDTSQDYFSDGLSEELLNGLARINDLQVAARTSAFSFKGTETDIATIARRLNVASVVEGSVRRSGKRIRVTAQLINAMTGFQLWSQTYDRDLGDVLRLQVDISNAVASALKVKLLSDVENKVELGGTLNPAAFDAYLRGAKAASSGQETKAIEGYTEAIRLDHNYALAFAGRSYSYTHYADSAARGTEVREDFAKGLADAHRAIALAPELGEGHLAMGFYLQWAALDFRQASKSYERARKLAPGSARVLRTYGLFTVENGHIDAGLADLRRAVSLDPLNPQDRTHLGIGLYFARRYDEAIAAFEEATSLDSAWWFADGFRGLAYYALGNLPSARSSCQSKVDNSLFALCLGLVYDKLGQHSDAATAITKLTDSYDYARIYAQRGDKSQAIEWLERAVRQRDTGLASLKTDPLLDPLRNEPRFQTLERELTFLD